MDIYASRTYKELLRARQKEMVRERPALTWKWIADKVPLRHTYLSRALNSDKAHLNEDHLFTIARFLGLSHEEADFLLLLRSHELAQSPERKKLLFGKISRYRKDKPLKAAVRDSRSENQLDEAAYLFDPLCVLVHAALHIPAVKREPRTLCDKMGVSPAQLKMILHKLQRAGFVDLGPGGASVREVRLSSLHYGRSHPFMRVHQSMLKTLIQSQLNRTEEEHKQAFVVTFTMDEHGFEGIKEEFQAFLKRVEQISSKCRDEHLYQLSFDLFRWI